MSEEINTENGFLHLSNDEKSSAEAKVEGERSFAVCTDGCVVHSHEGEFGGCLRSGGEADFEPCINEKLCACVSISYIKKATKIWVGNTYHC